MKVKIKLSLNVESFGTMKYGDEIIFINNAFDVKDGIVFHPVDTDRWNIISYELWSGLRDKNKREIFTGDYVRATISGQSTEIGSVEGRVCFDKGCFCIDIQEVKYKCGYDAWQIAPLFDFKTIEILNHD